MRTTVIIELKTEKIAEMEVVTQQELESLHDLLKMLREKAQGEYTIVIKEFKV